MNEISKTPKKALGFFFLKFPAHKIIKVPYKMHV